MPNSLLFDNKTNTKYTHINDARILSKTLTHALERIDLEVGVSYKMLSNFIKGLNVFK